MRKTLFSASILLSLVAVFGVAAPVQAGDTHYPDIGISSTVSPGTTFYRQQYTRTDDAKCGGYFKPLFETLYVDWYINVTESGITVKRIDIETTFAPDTYERRWGAAIWTAPGQTVSGPTAESIYGGTKVHDIPDTYFAGTHVALNVYGTLISTNDDCIGAEKPSVFELVISGGSGSGGGELDGSPEGGPGGPGGGGGDPGGGTGGSGAKAEPALVRDGGNYTTKIWRWLSGGSSFSYNSGFQTGTFNLSNVGDRAASGDVDGDGDDDIVVAYQNPDAAGTFSFHVFKNGNSYAGAWYTSGTFSLGPVAGRLVVDDFTGDGKAEPALVRDDGDGTMTIWRWQSTGSSFSRITDWSAASGFDLANVGDRAASGDVDGDGKADIVMAYQISDGTFGFYVFKGGITSAGRWYTSGQFALSGVAGRLVVADFNGDGKAEPALARDHGDTMTIFRYNSTGTSFTHTTDYVSGAFRLSQVGNRVATGDIDGDGDGDIVMAYQNNDSTFTYHVFKNGNSGAEWYTSGAFNLSGVAGRLVVGNFG